MKNWKTKYFISFDGVATLLDDTEVSAKLFWKMMANCEKNCKDSPKDEYDEYHIEKDEYTDETDKTTKYTTYFTGCGCTRVIFTRIVCKDGYEFKH